MSDLSTAELPIAHVGHWFASVLYLMPVIFLGGGILWQRHRDRKLEDSGERIRDEDVPFSDE